MTEITAHNKLPEPIERVVVHWGEMGTVWGVNRSVAQIHALLFMSDAPRTAEDIAETLSLARSNVSNSLKELLSWSLIRRVQVLGDRRDYYEAEADMFEMVRRIATGRKQREIDPTIALLRGCVAQAEGTRQVSDQQKKRLAEMLGFMEKVEKGFDEIIRLPAPTLMRLISMGGTIAKFVAPKRKKEKE
ncbi:MAG: MarR family transcriptional regulator [Pseudomonadota bacterium]